MDITDQDKEIRNLFQDFSPRLGSSDRFMREVERRCMAVETLREICERKQKENRRAVVFAALAGFVAGILMAFAVPYIKDFIGVFLTHVMSALPRIPQLSDTALYYPAWIIAAAITVVVSLSTFSITKANARA